MIAHSLLMLSLIFCLISIMAANGMITFPIEKIGIPIYWKDVKWTWFIYRNLNNLEKVESDLHNTDVFRIKDTEYYVTFGYSWLFHVCKSESQFNIGSKYDLGGQSNKANYLTWWQKIIGRKIEIWYLANVA